MQLVNYLVGVVIGLVFTGQVSGLILKTNHVQDSLLTGDRTRAPGFKTRLTQKGLNFARDKGLIYLRQELRSLPIPDIHGDAGMAIGHIDYDVTGLHLSYFNIPSLASITPNQAAQGLTVRIPGISLSANGHWHYKKRGWIKLSDSGTVDASASSISLTLTTRIGRDRSNGLPTISSRDSDCSFGIGSLKVKFHGGASWLYNLFDSKIEQILKKSLVDMVCASVLDGINKQVTQDLESAKLFGPIFDGAATIDYALAEDPEFAGSVALASKGEVYPRNSQEECPLPVPDLPLDTDNSRMVFFYITDFLVGSAGYSLQKVGYLQSNVTPDNVHSSNDLCTSEFAFKYLIPQLAFLYPDLPMQISLNATSAPKFTIDPNGIKAAAEGHASFYAIQGEGDNSTLTHLFTLGVVLNLDFTIHLNGSTILWTATNLGANLTLINSDVGIIVTPIIQIEADAFIDFNLMPQLNDQGAIGIPLPQMDRINLYDPIITLGQDYIKIGVDVKYNWLSA